MCWNVLKCVEMCWHVLKCVELYRKMLGKLRSVEKGWEMCFSECGLCLMGYMGNMLAEVTRPLLVNLTYGIFHTGKVRAMWFLKGQQTKQSNTSVLKCHFTGYDMSWQVKVFETCFIQCRLYEEEEKTASWHLVESIRAFSLMGHGTGWSNKTVNCNISLTESKD